MSGVLISYVIVRDYFDLKREIERHEKLGKTLLGPDFMQLQPNGTYLVRFGVPGPCVSTRSEIARVHRENLEYYAALAQPQVGEIRK
jgi:hypothetical protein